MSCIDKPDFSAARRFAQHEGRKLRRKRSLAKRSTGPGYDLLQGGRVPEQNAHGRLRMRHQHGGRRLSRIRCPRMKYR